VKARPPEPQKEDRATAARETIPDSASKWRQSTSRRIRQEFPARRRAARQSRRQAPRQKRDPSAEEHAGEFVSAKIVRAKQEDVSRRADTKQMHTSLPAAQNGVRRTWAKKPNGIRKHAIFFVGNSVHSAVIS